MEKFNRFSSHLMLIRAMILLCIVVITEALLIPTILSSPRSAYAVGVESPVCKLTVQNTSPSLQNITRRYQIAFAAACPVLVKRFAARRDVANNVIVTFSSKVPPDRQASTTGNHIDLSSAFLQKRPYEAVGLLISELTHIIQNYPSRNPEWFYWAMADYVRSIYGPADDDWVLPSSVESTDTYQYSQGARFLHWLEQHATPTLVNQLNRAMQTRQSFSAVFQRLTGGTVDQLWSKYKANPDLAPFKRFPAPDGNKAVRSLSCKMTVQNNNPIAPRFQKVFTAACPILVKRFARRPDITGNVMLTFNPSGYPVYVVLGNSIVFDTKWLQEKPKNHVGVFIHALMHLIQNNNARSWFEEGMATYADSVYSPVGEPPAFPDSAGNSYKDGYGTTARFLYWLEQNTVPNIVDQLNRAIQTGPFFSETFQRLTGGTVDELWDKYKAKPMLKSIRRIPISV